MKVSEPLTHVDFGRRSVWVIAAPTVVLVLGGLAPPPIIMTKLFTQQASRAEGVRMASVWPGVLLLVAFAVLIVALIFYVAFAAYRYQLTDDGVTIKTWRGRRFFRWADAKKARVATTKGTSTLVVHFEGFARLRVCPADYRRGRSLYNAISSRLPVPVSVVPAQLVNVVDV